MPKNDKITNSRSNAAPSVVGKLRTRFDLSETRRLTCNTGDLVPFYVKEVLPGDTFDLKTATLTRLQTALHQTLDNAYLEICFFYVPNRIVMDDWDKLLGANDDPWARNNVIRTPLLYLSNYNASDTTPLLVKPMSLLNHLMLPAGAYIPGNVFSTLSDEQKLQAAVTALPLRDVFQIYNDWFRDENLDSVIAFSKGNSDLYINSKYVFDNGEIRPSEDVLKVNRFRDRFSSALPAPQKGAPVTFSLGSEAPVTASNILYPLGGNLKFGVSGFQPSQGSTYFMSLDDNGVVQAGDDLTGQDQVTSASVNQIGYSDLSEMGSISASNLVVNLRAATAITVNDLRLAIAAQVLSEQEARGGTRLTEVLFSQWNIKAPSLMLDRSEYLGGKRIPLQMLEVIQTSETTASYALGHEAGHGKTFDPSSGSALKSFMFHGYVIGLCFIRTARSYSQGIDRQFFRTDKYSYFNPIFDNIGELPIYQKELFVPTFDSTASNPAKKFGDVFGYQEAWYEYKEGLNRDTGYMQTGISGTLDTWHYGDDYTSSPILSASWLKEDAGRVDRTIAVTSTSTYGFQWSIMLDVEAYATRQMKKYSVPNTFGFGSK